MRERQAMTAKKTRTPSKYPQHKPWTGKYATLHDALMIECAPGRPMPEWLYESLVLVFDQYARGDITNLGEAFGVNVIRRGAVHKLDVAPGLYQWLAVLRERDPTIPLSKDEPRGAYWQAAQAFGISPSTAESYYTEYRAELARLATQSILNSVSHK